jgi:hypothetical protein
MELAVCAGPGSVAGVNACSDDVCAGIGVRFAELHGVITGAGVAAANQQRVRMLASVTLHSKCKSHRYIYIIIPLTLVVGNSQ